MHIHVPVMLLESLSAWFPRHEDVLVLDDRYGDMHSSGLSDPDSPDNARFFVPPAPSDPAAHDAADDLPLGAPGEH